MKAMEAVIRNLVQSANWGHFPHQNGIGNAEIFKEVDGGGGGGGTGIT